jgi:glycosyltransferase involved in cell wall biosynthesis
VVDNVLNLGRRSIDTRSWSVPGTLKIVPSYTQASIDSFFSDIDVLLFPTQCKESFGLSVREALIRDVWVISTDAGGAIEDIVPGENGDVIPLDDDGTKLAEAIGSLLADPSRLDDYRNPYAGQIRLFDDQAKELGGLLAGIASHTAKQWSTGPEGC